MPSTRLVFNVEDRKARAAFSRLKREVDQLEDEFGTTGREARAAGEAVDTLGDRSRRSASDIDHLGDAAQQRAAQIVQLDTQATTHMENFARTLAKLKANAEGTRDALTSVFTVQQVETPNFREAIAASDAYYNARIAKAKAALAQETQDSEASNQLQVQIFALERQRLQAQRQLETDRQRLLENISQQRIDAATAASNAEVEGFKASTAAAKAYTDQLQRQIDAMPRISSPDAQYGGFTSQLRQDFEDAENQGRSLLSVMREIAQLSFGPLDLDARIPDPGVRQQQIDDQIAAQARGAQTLLDIRQDAAEQGSQFIERLRQREARDLQKNLSESTRYYRQFANSVSTLLTGVMTGRIQGFEAVAKAFIANSLRIVARAAIEYQLRKGLDDTLTTRKIANIRKVAAAQQAGAAGAGNFALPGVGNHLGGLASRFGGSLSGGGLALGAASLLFPTEIKNLTGGIAETIGNLLSNVAEVPDKAFGAQQVFLKIGDNEAREITDLQEELRQEARV